MSARQFACGRCEACDGDLGGECVSPLGIEPGYWRDRALAGEKALREVERLRADHDAEMEHHADIVVRERDEARAEVERMRAEVSRVNAVIVEHCHPDCWICARCGEEMAQEPESRHRAALESLRERCAVTAGNMFVDDDDNVIGLAVLTSRIRRVPLEEP